MIELGSNSFEKKQGKQLMVGSRTPHASAQLPDSAEDRVVPTYQPCMSVGEKGGIPLPALRSNLEHARICRASNSMPRGSEEGLKHVYWNVTCESSFISNMMKILKFTKEARPGSMCHLTSHLESRS